MPRIEISEPFLLSDAGSTRATAYHMTNKSIRLGDTTHVTWLDAVAGVRVRSFDHKTNQWSATLALDEGSDNHTNPSLSITPEGRLRVAYGPHAYWDPIGREPWNQARFRLRVTVRPNDSTQWEPMGSVGYGATYACLTTDWQGRDHLVYRGGSDPHGAMYERRLAATGWDVLTRLSVQRIRPMYTFVGATMTIAPDDTLYAAFEYYRMVDDRSLGVCILTSLDGGETWTGIDGRAAKPPIEYSDDFAIPHHGQRPCISGLTIDENRELLAITHDEGPTHRPPLFNRFRNGKWETKPLGDALPGWDMQRGNMCYDKRGRILFVTTAIPSDIPHAERWGHPKSENFLIASHDGGRTWEATQIGPSEPSVANWHANISQAGPSRDMSTPLVIWTQGVPGDGCYPADKTKVFAAWVR